MDWRGKRVLVTGAGKGIGRATAVMLARRGTKVVAMTRSKEDLKTLAAEIDCEPVCADVADSDALRPAVLSALPVDMLVNCAGTTVLSSFIDTDPEEFDRVFAVNTKAPVIIGQIVARDWLRRGVVGAIVNVSSDAARRAVADHTAYCASKAALDAITRVMALELGPLLHQGQQRQPDGDDDADGRSRVERPGKGRSRQSAHSAWPFPRPGRDRGGHSVPAER